MTTRVLASDSLPDMIAKTSEGVPGAVVCLCDDGDSVSAPLLRFVDRVRRRDQVMLGFVMPITLERGHG